MNREESFLDHLETMKGVICNLQEGAEEWPFFPHHVEKMFKQYEIAEDFRNIVVKEYWINTRKILKIVERPIEGLTPNMPRKLNLLTLGLDIKFRKIGTLEKLKEF
ncbi:hypothetical protein CDAR_605961 [Caerostris darwini]|uniref:Uncharacterized protein n=1 Tax=Caerostris darwini TaxID=1538125 RepID=A0AAV4QMF4_9ARAC|nr:hypothetical protein CDAR_605961 [Caerostris darwini]